MTATICRTNLPVLRESVERGDGAGPVRGSSPPPARAGAATLRFMRLVLAS